MMKGNLSTKRLIKILLQVWIYQSMDHTDHLKEEEKKSKLYSIRIEVIIVES